MVAKIFPVRRELKEILNVIGKLHIGDVAKIFPVRRELKGRAIIMALARVIGRKDFPCEEGTESSTMLQAAGAEESLDSP
jgi:hypothetical protein